MAGARDKQTVGRLALREQVCLLASRRRHVRWRGLESPCSLCFQFFPLRAWRRPIFVSSKVMASRSCQRYSFGCVLGARPDELAARLKVGQGPVRGGPRLGWDQGDTG